MIAAQVDSHPLMLLAGATSAQVPVPKGALVEPWDLDRARVGDAIESRVASLCRQTSAVSSAATGAPG